MGRGWVMNFWLVVPNIGEEEVRDTLKNSLLPFYKTNIISWLQGSPRSSPECELPQIKLLLAPWLNCKKKGLGKDLKQRHGWRDGRKCLLRTICEMAETPFGRTRQDVLEEVIHLILTPSEDLPGTVNSTHQSVGQLYQEAERLGRSGGDCILAYPDCIGSPLESFTEIAFP
ncbi:hypothetical protein ANTQUA_LOCUS6884 [Anthophora quadrimaculata]